MSCKFDKIKQKVLIKSHFLYGLKQTEEEIPFHQIFLLKKEDNDKSSKLEYYIDCLSFDATKDYDVLIYKIDCKDSELLQELKLFLDKKVVDIEEGTYVIESLDNKIIFLNPVMADSRGIFGVFGCLGLIFVGIPSLMFLSSGDWFSSIIWFGFLSVIIGKVLLRASELGELTFQLSQRYILDQEKSNALIVLDYWIGNPKTKQAPFDEIKLLETVDHGIRIVFDNKNDIKLTDYQINYPGLLQKLIDLLKTEVQQDPIYEFYGFYNKYGKYGQYLGPMTIPSCQKTSSCIVNAENRQIKLYDYLTKEEQIIAFENLFDVYVRSEERQRSSKLIFKLRPSYIEIVAFAYTFSNYLDPRAIQEMNRNREIINQFLNAKNTYF